MTSAKFSPIFVVFCSVQSFSNAVPHFMKPKDSTAKNWVKALPDPTSVERNDKNIRENQGKELHFMISIRENQGILS